MADWFEVTHPEMDNSFVFNCTGDLDTVGNTVRHLGLFAYETPVTNILIELVKRSPGVVLDIGANTGLYALAAAAASNASRVIAFEPLDSVRALLAANVDQNPELANRIVIEPVGLSNETGSFSFYETINNLGYVSTSSSLEQHHVQEVGDQFVERVIRTVRLDEFGDTLGNQPVTFMKIDVEGHEHAVVSGGRRFIAKHRPIFTLEILGNAEVGPINTLLVEGDYLSFAIAPDTLRQCQRARFFSDAWNHLFVPAEKAGVIFHLCRKLGLRIELG